MKLTGRWKNAFTITGQSPPPLESREEEWLKRLSGAISSRGLSDAAVFTLESTRPLHHLGAQAMYFLAPLSSFIIEREKMNNFARMMENPGSIEYLLKLLRERREEEPKSDSHGK